MSSDYEFSDSEEDYYDDEDMMDEDQDSVSEMDMDNDDFKVPTKDKKKSYDVEYKSLSQDAVQNLMNAELEHISGIFGVDKDVAALLLRHSSWNKESLIEEYMDSAAAVNIAAGITAPESEPAPTSSTRRRTVRSSAPKSSSSKRAAARPTRFTCPICFDDSPSLQTRSLSCDHAFCTGCWSAYLTSKIRDEGEHFIRCMAEGCTIAAQDTFIRSILLSSESEQPEDDLHTWSRFHELAIRDFVAANKTLKYCPYPSCTNTVSCSAASSKRALTTMVPIVSCGARGLPSAGGEDAKQADDKQKGKEHVFCFGCPVDCDHRPCVCGVAKRWLKKCRDDSETANWIKSNTKECPQCNSTIEKNGGCNHMTCKKCKHEFCWVCMGPWSEHGNSFYSCNRYEEKSGMDARDAQSKSRAALERYLHYYNRWANHEQSAKLSVDLYRNTEKKMEDIQITSSLTWIEVQFMKKAVDEVVKCRTTLQWTYAMAYFLEAGNQKELFEDNQRDLEKAVEDLSELLESQIEAETIPTLRQKVTDKTVYVQNRNEVVLEDTANGLQEGRWRWNVPIEGFDNE